MSSLTTPTKTPPNSELNKISWVTVISNALLLTLGTGVAQALMAVSVLLTARQLGSVRFGEYAASFSAAGLTAVLFNFGLDTWLLQSGSRAPEKLGTLIGNAYTIKALAGVLWIGGMLWIFPQLNPQTFDVQLVLISTLSIWMEGFFTIGLSVFRALLRNQLTALLLIGVRSGILVITIVLVAIGAESSKTYAWARLIMATLAAFAVWLSLPAKPSINSIAMLKTAGRESLPFALSDLFASIYLQADTTIAAVALSKEEVGLYAPASSLINALFVIPNALFLVAVPVLVRVLQGDRRSFCRALSLVCVSFTAIGIILWSGVRYTSYILSRSILGESFERSAHLLTILSPILLLKSWSFAAAAILVSVGWQNRRVYVQIVSAIANVALNLVIIRYWGIKGIAIVYVTSEAILLIGYIGLVIQMLCSHRLSFICN